MDIPRKFLRFLLVVVVCLVIGVLLEESGRWPGAGIGLPVGLAVGFYEWLVIR